MDEFRLKRVEHLLRGEISTMILSDQIKDPRVSSFISITEIKVSKDLAYAKVHVSSFERESEIHDAVEALNHASGYIQSRLSKKLKLRVTPRLTFVADSSIREGFEVTSKLQEFNH